MASFTNSKDITANSITLLSGNDANDTTALIADKANTATTQTALNTLTRSVNTVSGRVGN